MEKADNYDAKNGRLGKLGFGIAAGLLSLVMGCAQPEYNQRQCNPQTVAKQAQPVQQQVQKVKKQETPAQVLATIKYNIEELLNDGEINRNKDGNNEYKSFFKLREMYSAIDRSKLSESDKQFYDLVGKELEKILDKILENAYCNVVLSYLNPAGQLVVRGTTYELTLQGSVKEVLKAFNIPLEEALKRVSDGFNPLGKDGKVSFDEFYKFYVRVPATPANKDALKEMCKDGLGEGVRKLSIEELELLLDSFYQPGVNPEVQHIAISIVINRDTVVDLQKVEEKKKAAQPEKKLEEEKEAAQLKELPSTQPQLPPEQPQQPDKQQKLKKIGQTPSSRLLGSE